MKKSACLYILLFLATTLFSKAGDSRNITYRVYFDKVYGGWVGKALGLAMGVPKEYSEPWPPSEFDYFGRSSSGIDSKWSSSTRTN